MEEKNKTKNQPPVPNPTSEQTPPVPETPKTKPKLKFPILMLGVVVFLMLVGLVSASIFLKSKQNPKQESKTIVKVSPVPVSTANWKTYTNNSFSFKYPNDWDVASDSGKTITIGQEAVNGHEIFLTISRDEAILQLSEAYPFGKCSQVKTGRCLDDTQNVKNGAFYDTYIGGERALGFYLAGAPDYSYHVVRIIDPPIELKMYTAGGDLDQKFSQILSSFKFVDEHKFNSMGWKLITSFVNSKGKTQYIALRWQDEVVDGVIPPPYYYLSNSPAKNDEAIKLSEAHYSYTVQDKDIHGPFISTNSGLKYIFLEGGAGDGSWFYLVDETGRKIGKLDTSKMGLGTKIPGQYGLTFLRWIDGSTNFIIKAVSGDGTEYEATFDATTGKQVGETRQTK